MKLQNTLIFSLVLLLVFGVILFLFPKNGIPISNNQKVFLPSITDIFTPSVKSEATTSIALPCGNATKATSAFFAIVAASNSSVLRETMSLKDGNILFISIGLHSIYEK